MDLNTPDTRQDVLRRRLAEGAPLVAHRIAREFGVSADTIRRDLIALEAAGQARRVRGGAVRAATPADPMSRRLAAEGPDLASIARRAAEICNACDTLILDGGTTVLALAHLIEPSRDRVVVTPSPWIAVACATNGVEVVMLGGRLTLRGGINAGPDTEAQLAGVSADVAVLGACGLDPEFGLSSDDLIEVGVKRAMAGAARRTLVLADRGKLGRRARHRTLEPGGIGRLVTDAGADAAAPLAACGIEVIHA